MRNKCLTIFLSLLLILSSSSTAFCTTILVGDDINYPPYSFLDENDNPVGFNIDLMKAVAEVMELDVEFKLGHWNDVRQNLEAGKIDVISGMFYSAEREQTFSFTTKHTSTSGEIFSRSDMQVKELQDLKGLTVVVQKDDILHEYLKKHEDLEIDFITVSTVSDALRLVSQGEYDYAAVSKIPGHYLINHLNLSNLLPNNLSITPENYSMAVQKDNHDLLVTLNGGLQIIHATGRYQEIHNQWLGIYETDLLWQKAKEYSWIAALIMSMLLILSTWSFTLRRTVSQRTKELVNANNELQESKEELFASYEEIENSLHELAASEEGLRWHNDKLRESEQNLSKSEERNRAIVSAIPDLLFVVNADGYVTDCQITNDLMPSTSFIGKTIWDVMPTEAANLSHKKIQSSLQSNCEALESFEYETQLQNGSNFYEVRIVKASEKEVIAISRNITQRRQMEQALAEEKELLQTTLLSVGDGVIVTNLSGKIKMMNMAAESLTGWSLESAQSKPFQEVFHLVDEDTQKPCENPINAALAIKDAVTLKNTALITKTGQQRVISYNVAPIKDKQNNLQGAVLVFRDVTEERAFQKSIEYLSFHDQLTGLYNRRSFEEELKRMDVSSNLPLTIVMADVNGLKLINDSFGHDTGDTLLKTVAKVIQKACRSNDVVSRIGGDEFVLLLPNSTASDAEEIITQIQTACKKEKVASVDISISFGFETKERQKEDVSVILKKAEDFMYKKKLFEGPSMRGKTISAIIKALHEKNSREEAHSSRVSAYCSTMGQVLGLTQDEIYELKSVGLLHDIGKIAIDDAILNKTGELLTEEIDELKRHPEIGYRILSSVNDMAEMAEQVLAHHERWDGKGYPKGLAKEEIPLKSRIIAISDAYAMISERAYRSALSPQAAIKELQDNAGTQFDPTLVPIFIKEVAMKPNGNNLPS